MISLHCTPQRRDHQHSQRRQRDAQMKAAGVQNSCDTLFDDAGKIWCCRTAHRPAVNMLSLGCDANVIINIALQAVCYTNEPAAGVQNSCDTPLMMLARFVLQDCSQTSSQHAVSRL
jgi:hypothetical protein